ncbi:cupin domain-containing protein [Sinorhizobium meliloti]|uniref:cupin domain-containing protein n=1 Tax=Rhizobium meliloti TaxID=382 RepID=UPI000FDC4C2B|nr:cupin domain-containing protein [Sinorhizobium meliloti]RVL04757.1 cupin domain-containing protein [Sinorhizobium meliloti]RVN50612.1 cupin domain-containing protein [Sinorhizobium meliloti]
MKRPGNIKSIAEFELSYVNYPGDDEAFSLGATLSRPLGLERLGVHYEILPPGHRTSWPHAEEKEEEFVIVLSGQPDVWMDGESYRLKKFDCVAFPPGTGIAHTFLNNTANPVELLVVGERIQDNRIFYPYRPEGWKGMPKSGHWRIHRSSEEGALGPEPVAAQPVDKLDTGDQTSVAFSDLHMKLDFMKDASRAKKSS